MHLQLQIKIMNLTPCFQNAAFVRLHPFRVTGMGWHLYQSFSQLGLCESWMGNLKWV